MDIKYNRPTCTDIAVCMCFFSPAGFQRPKNNFLHVQKLLTEATIPTFTIECVIGNQEPLLTNPTVQVRSNSCLFYKEQLYNLLVPKVPEQYTKLIFIDADILFEDKNWVDNISNLLNTHDVVHCFKTATLLKYDNIHPMKNVTSTVSVYKDTGIIEYRNHHGFGYGLTRQFYNNINGFFDKCIFGTGDTFFLNSCVPMKYTFYNVSEFIRKEYDKYLGNINQKDIRITYLPTRIFHLYHGSIENRKYVTRYEALKTIEIKDWNELFYTNNDGIYEIKSNDFKEITKEYFLSRKEDDVDIMQVGSWKVGKLN